MKMDAGGLALPTAQKSEGPTASQGKGKKRKKKKAVLPCHRML
jgi:hypothetical protein